MYTIVVGRLCLIEVALLHLEILVGAQLALSLSLFVFQIVKECRLVGALLPGMEVAAPFSKEAFLSDVLGSGFTSVVYSSLDGFAFVFAGTTDGTLHQVRVDRFVSVSSKISPSALS